jgi:hypothetical protein
MQELRTPVMIRVEASCEDENGTLRTIPARMEDKSAGGACIRINTPIPVGAKLNIQWRMEQFSGAAKYCRPAGRDFLIGIQRDAKWIPLPLKPPAELSSLKKEASSPPPPSAVPTAPPRPEFRPRNPYTRPAARPRTQTAPAPRPTRSAEPPPAPAPENTAHPRSSRPQEFEALHRIELRTKQPPAKKDPGEERKPMRRKWLDLPWQNKNDEVTASAAPSAHDTPTPNLEKESPVPPFNPPAKKTPAPAAREVPAFQVELLPMEEIYRAAGVTIPRKGYSIKKVIEMMNSEHLRALSKDMKRVAVLMALDAAGVPIDDVVRDANTRKDALDVYEQQQKQQAEAEWARRTEENAQIQSELESIKAHYTARIARNLDGIAREKSTFHAWQTTKQEEAQSIAEAVDLCLNQPAPEPPNAKVMSPSPLPTHAPATQESHPDPGKALVADNTLAKAATAK